MLKLLRIENLALMERAEIRLGAGLAIFTGESGSGKSTIVDALSLLCGSSQSRLAVRTKQRVGSVEGHFFLQRQPDGTLANCELAESLAESGLLKECMGSPTDLVLKRSLTSRGRTKCFIQGRAVTRSVLRKVANHLLQVCGQGASFELRSHSAQLEALDRFAGLDEKRREVARAVRELTELQAELRALEANTHSAEKRKDLLEYQKQELDGLGLADASEKALRREALQEEVTKAGASQELGRCLSGPSGVLSTLKRLSRLVEADGTLRVRVMDPLETAIDALSSCERSAQLLAEEQEERSFELASLNRELQVLLKVAQKHRIDLSELIERKVAIDQELVSMERVAAQEHALRSKVRRMERKVQGMARELHGRRAESILPLQTQLQAELCSVGMGGATIDISLGSEELTSSGVSHLSISFSANPGHPPRPLHRVASGGEMSRILLCLRLVTETAGATLLFDEIDAGAGGKTADRIADALSRAARRTQVLTVTHWPQVAGRATAHFCVEKRVFEGTARTELRPVQEEERILELSRMLGGTPETARLHAAQLLQNERGDVASKLRIVAA